MRSTLCLLPMLGALALPGGAWAQAAPVPAGTASLPGAGHALAAAMDEASRSEGFRLRARVDRDGTGDAWRLLMAGEKDARRQRLLLRVQSPEAERGQALVLEAQTGRPPQARRFNGERTAERAAERAADGMPARPVDAAEPFLGTGLVPWDFTGAWWHWPRQRRVGEEPCLMQRCEVLESTGGSSGDGPGGTGPAAVVRVRSWYAPQLRLVLRLAFHAADGTRLRELRVDRFFRRPDGSGVARAMTVSDAHGGTWRVDVYNGEEGVALAPDTFSTPR